MVHSKASKPEGGTSGVHAVVNNRGDEALLQSLGYRQELRRTFTPLELFGIGFSVIGLFPSMASVLVYALPNGGAVALVWGWAACSIFLVFIGLALAELGSAAPTSGGLYYWTHSFSSPRYKNVLSWIVGYSNTIGNLAGAASVDWGCAVQLMAAVSIGSDLTFTPTTGQTYGVFAAILLAHGAICSMAAKYIARLQKLFIALNVLLCLAIIIGVPAATPVEFKNTAKFSFGNFQNLYGWTNGFAFILSFLAPLWTVGGYDASIHISEEANNASVAVPWAILSSVVVACILGFALNVAIAFNMGTDMEAILSSPTGQPMAAILFNSFGKNGTLAVWAIVVVVQFMMGMSIVTVCSRQTFAFARDGGLPFSHYLRRINSHTGVPMHAVWFCASISLLLGLLAFAGSVAIGAIFSLAIAGQYTAYSIPIAARFLGQNDFKKGAFSLGFMSLPVAVVAVTFMGFMLIVFFFPATPAPTAANMNYTIVVFGGTIFLSLLYFYFPKYGGKTWFNGPVSTLNEIESLSEGRSERSLEKARDQDSFTGVQA
ncbi:APC amino acid permease [Artomyces pyxidatus]|uniref:APC amino acid permease n=1 Tax=Artomyces pyxidatus TaxID=48021 RepID=A0ACB8T9U3_9AGAM|nr:APC amino acid permease [Artomyces pyxidatus]